jgi:transposase
MKRAKQVIRTIIRGVIDGRLGHEEAAKELRVSVRTVRNYVRKFLAHGPDGLVDHRRGHFRKIGTEHESRIVTCKLDYPHRSARWIKDRLMLPVSVEAVRQILVKHRLNHANLGRRVKLSRMSDKWSPF